MLGTVVQQAPFVEKQQQREAIVCARARDCRIDGAARAPQSFSDAYNILQVTRVASSVTTQPVAAAADLETLPSHRRRRRRRCSAPRCSGLGSNTRVYLDCFACGKRKCNTGSKITHYS